MTDFDGIVTINSTRFSKEETGWRIVDAITDDHVIYSLVGVFPPVVDGDEYRVTGTIETHHRFGEQIKVATITEVDPLSPTRSYLAAIRGIGPVTAKNITNHFRTDTIDVLNTNPRRLIEVTGIGEKKLATIIESWDKYRDAAELGIIIAGAGLGTGVTARIIEAFGVDDAADMIRANPYQAMKISGIGWETCDQIARHLGIDGDDPHRITAGMHHIIAKGESDGHCYQPASTLTREAASLLGIHVGRCNDIINQLSSAAVGDEPVLVVEPGPDGEDVVYTYRMWRAERDVASRLGYLLNPAPRKNDPLDSVRSWSDEDWQTALADAQLDADQTRAVRTALSSRVMVLTGGPGTGKTYTIQRIVQIMQQANATLCLCAPTGRASQRMQEVINHPASTIHRRLAKLKNDDDQGGDYLPEDVVIVDEVSMMDIWLARQLLRAIKPGATLILVGDEDQLPSVGPGKFLADLISSHQIPIVQLTAVHRQSGDSGIITVAHSINSGVMPSPLPVRDMAPSGSDVYFLPAADATDAANATLEAVTWRIPHVLGVTPMDIQVLAPMRRGADGILALNERLQSGLNGGGEVIPSTVASDPAKQFTPPLRVGDRVIQTVNNYTLEVFNGTPGVIIGMEKSDGVLNAVVSMDDGSTVYYSPSDIRQLTLAYALTIHKSQGSEYPIVVIPITSSSYMMQRRNLLYTAVTRARNAVVLIGRSDSIRRCVDTPDTRQRHTGLAQRLVTLLGNNHSLWQEKQKSPSWAM